MATQRYFAHRVFKINGGDQMTIVGEGKFRYEVDQDWLRNKPAFWELGQCADVGVDSKDRIWLFSRSKHPVTCWTPDGEFIGSVSYTHLTLPTICSV